MVKNESLISTAQASVTARFKRVKNSPNKRVFFAYSMPNVTSYQVQDGQQKTVEKVPYTPEEIKARDIQIQELNSAYEQRQAPYTELDDMCYDRWYLENKKAASGYVKPRANPHEVRTNSAVVRSKSLALVSQLLEYKFEPDVEAYDESNQPDRVVGELAEDMIRKSRQIENYDAKRAFFYKELIDQGNVFVWERFCEQAGTVKEIENFDVEDLSKMKWKERIETLYSQCEAEIVPGLNVYLGNIREPDMQKQPFIGISFERTRSEVFAKYGNWERFKYVPFAIQRATDDQGTQIYADWSMIEVRQNMVEELHYFNPFTNTYQIFLNGVAMLKVGFPLQYVAGGRIKIPVIKGDSELISPNFAYCRSVASKNKFNQQVMDEFLRSMIIKTRNSYSPAMANMTGKKLTQKIFYPSTIHEGIHPEKLVPIMQPTGVTSAEFNMMQYIKGAIDDDSVSSIFQGNEAGGRTATESSLLMKQTMMKLGLLLLGVTNFEKELAWQRLFNINQNWTKPVDVQITGLKDGLMQYANVYRSETVESTFEDGRSGKRIIEFSEELPDESQVEAEEELLSSVKGEPIRKIYVDPKGLENIKHKFYIEIVPVEKQTSELRKAMFEQTALKMLELFPDTTNREFVQKQMAINSDMDPDKIIMKSPSPQMGAPMAGGEAVDQGLAGQMLPKELPRPSVNTLANA